MELLDHPISPGKNQVSTGKGQPEVITEQYQSIKGLGSQIVPQLWTWGDFGELQSLPTNT